MAWTSSLWPTWTERPDDPWDYVPIGRGLCCPHSLVVADLNGDGRPDVIAGEMTAG